MAYELCVHQSLTAAGWMAMNDAGSIALLNYVPFCPEGFPFCFVDGDRVLRVDQGTPVTIAEPDHDRFFFFSDFMTLNNDGDVAFVAFDTESRSALYVGDGARTRRVIGAGDALFGRTVVDVFPGVLNDRGQLAVTVLLDDGATAALLATPQP